VTRSKRSYRRPLGSELLGWMREKIPLMIALGCLAAVEPRRGLLPGARTKTTSVFARKVACARCGQVCSSRVRPGDRSAGGGQTCAVHFHAHASPGMWFRSLDDSRFRL